MKQLLATVALAFLSSCLAIPSSACSAAGCLNEGIETRKSFAVTVKHAGKPLSGVAVQIAGKSSEVFSGETSMDGTVSISLPPGEYWLEAKLLGISAAHDCFHIKEQSSRKARRNLAYDWGDEAPATQRIAGKLIDSQPGSGGNPLWNILHRVDVPISGASLKLQNPTTGNIYTTTSGSDGQFTFDPIPNGTYILHIEGGAAGDRGYDSTDLLIALAPHARRNSLLLTRRDDSAGSCGGTSLELQNTN